MFRFYRKHYAPRGGQLLSAAVYAGIAAKLFFSVARNAVRNGNGTGQRAEHSAARCSVSTSI